MRVLCVNKTGKWVVKRWKPITTSYFFGLKKITKQERVEDPTEGPKYGETCTVIKQIVYTGENAGLYYLIAGWEDYGDYKSTQFMPVQEQETEIPQVKEKLSA